MIKINNTLNIIKLLNLYKVKFLAYFIAYSIIKLINLIIYIQLT
jgi:hypothetical protein